MPMLQQTLNVLCMTLITLQGGREDAYEWYKKKGYNFVSTK